MYFISQQLVFESFYNLLIIYMIIYMPTLALINAITLNQIKDAEKEFSLIRVWGTVGWIVAGLIIGWLAIENNPNKLHITFLISGIVSAIFGFFCFTLPNTPPKKVGQKLNLSETFGLDALKILADKNYLTFFIASILICIPLAFYYGQANIFLNEINLSHAAAKMTLGQISEIVFLFLMPLFFVRYGIKQMLLFGMIAWTLRYFLFAYGNTGSEIYMLYAGILLHGICYDFFFVAGQIYTDKKADDKIRSSAQGLITLATYGVGMYIGFYLAGIIVDKYAIDSNNHDWTTIWLYPAIFALVVAILFKLFFNEKLKVANKST